MLCVRNMKEQPALYIDLLLPTSALSYTATLNPPNVLIMCRLCFSGFNRIFNL